MATQYCFMWGVSIISPGMAVTSASSENKGSEWLAAYWAAMTHWGKKAPDGARNHNDIWGAREMARAAALHWCCKKVDGRLASEPNKLYYIESVQQHISAMFLL